MAVFEYEALDDSGRAVKGIAEADSRRQATAQLRSKDIYVTKISSYNAAARRLKAISLANLLPRRNRTRQLSVFTRQMTALLKAGVPLVEALSALVEQTEDRYLTETIIDVREKVIQGQSLSEAMNAHPGFFPDLYVNMVRAGELSGALEDILARLADYTEKQNALRNRIQSIMIYPAVMMLIGGSVLMFLLYYVVPQVMQIFTGLNKDLPLPTIILVRLNDFMQKYGLLIIVLLIGVIGAIKIFINTARGRLLYDKFKLKIPLLGGLLRKSAMARFSRTLGTLLSSGVPLVTAMDVVKDIVGNQVLAGIIDQAKEQVIEGSDLALPLGKSGLFPPLVTKMISVGERTGQIEEMLLRVAQIYEEDVEVTLSGMVSLIEPLIIVAMGLVVLFIVLSILLPILEMNQMVRIG